MKNIYRSFYHTLRARLKEDKPLMQVVVGPRQVGKTTAIKQLFESGGVYESADSPTPFEANIVIEWWQKALAHPSRCLAIDEVQKIRSWSEIIKKLWDQNPFALKVILTGSSALLIEKGLSETLAGRYELIRANHWSLAEAALAFSCTQKQYLEFGCYPGSMHLLHDITRWGTYIRDSIIEPAIGRDILSLHPVNNPSLLRQLFAVACGMPTAVISLQKLCGQLQDRGSIATIQHYLLLLSQGFLVTSVEKYSSNMLRAKKSSPKLIVHDNALLRAFERPIEASLTLDRMGYYFENNVGARFIEAGWDVWYWKERDLEVDFVVHGPKGEKYAIEVKSATTTLKELAGLKKFCKENPEFTPCLVSGVDQEIEGITALNAAWILSLGA